MEKGFENHNISLVPSFWADTDPTANSYLKQDSHEIWRKAGVLGYPSHGLRASSGAGGQSRWGTGGHYCLFIIQVPVQNASILGTLGLLVNLLENTWSFHFPRLHLEATLKVIWEEVQ